MSYKELVERVKDFIGKHLDEELEMDELCHIASFSKCDFHLLFTVYINIALDAGFESPPLRHSRPSSALLPPGPPRRNTNVR